MKIGILQTGKVNEALVDAFGEYPPMFDALLRPASPTVQIEIFAVVDDVMPTDPMACEAWLVTGSKHGVYDDLPWIEPLKAFLAEARRLGRPIVGICFGHQILAEAFGGKAEKSDRGWGVGVQDYAVYQRPGWMADAPETLSLHAIHQDQVTAIPADATVLAGSEFCPYGMLTYGDPDAPDAISIQPHPEFDRPFAEALLARLAGDRVPMTAAGPALESFGREVHSAAFARWCMAYLDQHTRRAAAA